MAQRLRVRIRAHRPLVRVSLNVGNVLELVSAGLLIYGIYLFVGMPGAIITGAICSAVFAELLYDDTKILLWTRKRRPNDLPDLPPHPGGP